ncbi:MAG: hypothetical protein SWY16_25195 [Cyanobacteriota bacterium]|nr:hypothetical protein [Cyanobacteriota bacterium]
MPQLTGEKNVPDLALLPGAISEILASVRDTGVLTKADCYGLMAAALDESLNDCDRRSVNRLVRSVLKGQVRVSDCLSVVAYSLEYS